MLPKGVLQSFVGSGPWKLKRNTHINLASSKKCLSLNLRALRKTVTLYQSFSSALFLSIQTHPLEINDQACSHNTYNNLFMLGSYHLVFRCSYQAGLDFIMPVFPTGCSPTVLKEIRLCNHFTAPHPFIPAGPNTDSQQWWWSSAQSRWQEVYSYNLLPDALRNRSCSSRTAANLSTRPYTHTTVNLWELGAPRIFFGNMSTRTFLTTKFNYSLNSLWSRPPLASDWGLIMWTG